jgi:cyclic pyranopterin phosphate synthase
MAKRNRSGRSRGPGRAGSAGREKRAALSHVDARGRVKMVDVGAKAVTAREAVARGTIVMSREALRLVRTGRVKKGDPLQTARLAGILAAKQTSALIPLCHPLPLTSVDVELTPRARGYDIEARVRTTAQTGVEMEALTAVAVAALTIYDMVKAVDKTMVIGEIRLMSKTGGRSGTYTRQEGRRAGRRNGKGRKAGRQHGKGHKG